MVTKYVYDREDVLFEFDENDQIKARYTHGPGIDEPISVDRDTDADGTLDTTYYYQYDGLGSITAITDVAGTVVQTYVYDTFGKIVQQTGSVENVYTYTGREWDAEAGLYYYRARYYDPTIGRFINGDPIGFAGGDVNFYVYVQNNPVNVIDPFGLDAGLYYNPADPTSLDQGTASNLENQFGLYPGTLGGKIPERLSFQPHPSLPLDIKVPEDLINTPKGDCIKRCIEEANAKQKELKERCLLGSGPASTLKGHIAISKFLGDCIKTCK